MHSPNRKYSIYLIAAAFFGLGIFASYLWFTYGYLPQHPSADINLHPIQLGKTGLVNPLLAYTVPQDFTVLGPLGQKLQKETDQTIQNGVASNIAIYFRDLDAARWTGVNVTGQFSPASLLKVPLMIAYLKLAESQPSILNEQLTYDGSTDDNALENIKPLKAIKAGKSYTVDELIKYMIGYSDNNASTLLFNNLYGIDPNAFKQVFTDLGVPFPTSQSDYLGPRVYSLFFRVLYNATYLSPELSQKALTLLAYADFPQGLAAGIPENIIAAQKFGEHTFQDGTAELHDCGIVYHPKHPYFLCVMTKGTDLTKLTNVIHDISSIVYQSVDSDYKN